LTAEEFVTNLEQMILRLLAERDAAIEAARRFEKENLELKKRLAFYENPHTPSSVETLRKKVKKEQHRKRGAPIGHKGATRAIPDPERVVHSTATQCPRCHQDPGAPTGTVEKTIEEMEAPPKITATKHTLDKFECQHCGLEFTATHSDCPKVGNFGPKLLVYITMLKYHMRGPLRRVQEFMWYQNDFEVSPKGIMDMLLRVGDACKANYDRTIAKVRAAKWRYIDETGMKVNGKNYWLWIFRTDEGDVLVVIRKSRGSKVLEEILGKDHVGPDVADGWRAYSYIETLQRCWAHLLREVDDYKDASGNGERLSDEVHNMFMRLSKTLSLDPSMDERKRLKKMFDKEMIDLVKKFTVFEELEKPVGYIQRGLGSWFTCLLFPGMEPTNNLGEQAMREHVIIRKIIGCFRSENGSQNYQYIASLLATCKLQGKNIFFELENVLRKELCMS
jgi:transposase